MREAVQQAKELVTLAIQNSLSMGSGHGPVHILEKGH
jgi:hydroxymethylpyrimidine/phosphomethylpyrimidine kinase